MQLVHTNAELDQLVADAKAEGKRVAFVPTMGALHEGHLRLVDIAREHAEFVVVSIFVNPLQFGEGEDFDRYPRTLEADVEALEGHPCDVVFAPWVEEVYPPEGKPGKPTERAGIIGSTFEGAARPGHFDGMLTVVGRLFDLVKPDVAVFGQKDAQQLFMVRKLAGAKFEGLEIITVDGKMVELSARELGLLEVLLQRAGRLVSKDQLVERLCEWGEEVSNNAIEVYIHRLRKKIEKGPIRIATVRGLGYCLEKIPG